MNVIMMPTIIASHEFSTDYMVVRGFPGGSPVKNLPGSTDSNILAWEKSYGQNSLASHSPWGRKRVEHD